MHRVILNSGKAKYLRCNSYFRKNFPMEIQQNISQAWRDRELLKELTYSEAVRTVIEEVDKGRLRAASPAPDGAHGWVVNEWVKQAILLYFSIQQMRVWDLPPFEFYDKMPLKNN